MAIFYAAEPTDIRRYVPLPPNLLSLDAVRTTEEKFEQVQLGSPHLEIVAARRMGRSKAILVTVRGNEVPSYPCYGPIICQFYEYREREQACTSCRQMGHRADTCPQGGSKLCPNCGVEHELPPIVDGRRAYTCTPNCVICGGKHFTGSKECNKGYVPRQKVKPGEDRRHRSPSV
ncbi:hypothetical protein HPB47_022440 [Ixodes persulcatus]|uniref:Uncharacterized protein n=1 Tax=Ixodes persulcatus TaxID=34615 RepID=A0AC60Q9R5_IXOPE|nr:hypothetical protein HPB47_022440 [Ixodes persulcatus]